MLEMYARGFWGAPREPAQAQNKSQAIVGGSTTRVNMTLPRGRQIAGQPMVDSIYSQWLRADPVCRTFEFRKAVFLTAMSAFGTKSFLDWYFAQIEVNTLGDDHHRFLNDTLDFISTGKRAYSLETWQVLLEPNTTIEPPRVSDTAKAFFNLEASGPLCNRDWPDVLQRWLSKPSSFNDLIGTLHILFGSK